MADWKEIKVMVEGGKANSGPPLGSTLGPLGLNVANIVKAINEKTKTMAGMQVPAIVTYDPGSKQFDIKIGTPPAAALIKKEAGIQKGSGNPKEMVADLKIEQIIKIAKIKEDGLPGRTLKEKVKQIVGTCDSMGVMVEGKRASDSIKDIAVGMFDKQIKEEKTELTAEELKALQEEKKRLQAELEEKRHEYEAKAKEIIASMEGKEKKEIKAKLHEAEIPEAIIKELLPDEKAEAGKPAGGKAAKPEAKK